MSYSLRLHPGRRSFIFFVLSFLYNPLTQAASMARCSVCGMDILSNSKTTFQVHDRQQPTEVCSFSCASKISDRHPNAKFKVRDYSSGEWISTENSFFLVKSNALANELGFSMPPAIAVFQSIENAESAQKRLGDGEIVKGFSAAKLRFR